MPLARSQKGTFAALLAALGGIAAGFLWLSNRILCLDRGGVSTNILADQSLALVTAMATLTLTLIWLIFGKNRITIRSLPFIGCATIITAVLALLFRSDLSIAWTALISTMIPIVAVSFPLWGVRFFGFSIHRDNPIEHKGASGKTRFPIRDLLLITLFLSLGFAALRPVMRGAHLEFYLLPVIAPLIVSAIATPIVFLLALSPWRWTFRMTVVMILAATVHLCAFPIAAFIAERDYLVPKILDLGPPSRVIATVAITLFAVLLPERLRGWRIRRIPGPRTQVQISGVE